MSGRVSPRSTPRTTTKTAQSNSGMWREASAKLSIFDCRLPLAAFNRKSAVSNRQLLATATALFQRLPPLARLTCATMVWMVVVAVVFASFLPARRASRADPMSALREE